MFDVWQPSICTQKREDVTMYYCVGFHGRDIIRDQKLIYPRPVFIIVKEIPNMDTVIEVCQLNWNNLVKILAGFLCLAENQREWIGKGELDGYLFSNLDGSDARGVMGQIAEEMRVQLKSNQLIRNVTLQQLKGGILKKNYKP